MGEDVKEPAQTETGTKEPEPDCEEIRLALAMNGGVSLAVWMAGCAVELDRARRAQIRTEAGHDCAAGTDATEGVYDLLAGCFGRRLVIDVLTGTSAGGINAALLGAAMTHGRTLDKDVLREKWIELGDLGKILHKPSEESPAALMDGKLFHEKLEEVFEWLLDEQKPSAAARAHARVPALDITMTDLMGVERRFRDKWGGDLVAREHRPRFRFRRREHFTKSALADAARTTASFPFAFEPWKVEGRSRILAGLPGQAWGIDGGLLDNAPIRGALDLIPTRGASTVVRRYFCYVNGDPTTGREESIGTMPKLTRIGGYAVSLPREAPLVDHLYAIQDAVDRPLRTNEAQERLLTLDAAYLDRVADSLFRAYVKRRQLESLEEILPEPRDARAAFEQLDHTGGSLPWIPSSWSPGTEPTWEWGLRPAQRILHLALDLLRPAIDTAGKNTVDAAGDGSEERGKLLAARIQIDSQLTELGDAYQKVTGAEATSDPSRFEEEGPDARVNAACREAKERAPTARSAVEEGLKTLRGCVAEQPGLFPAGTRERLFGSGSSADEEVRFFLRRALAIEVIRRAFASEADIESAEKLHFVQLTPEAPSPLFSPNPIHLPGPASARQKLTGVGLGHFAGFYRRSWRANDFMWGRLDAAARIVDLLLDSPSPEFGIGAKEERQPRIEARAKKLASYLIEEARGEEWLLKEVLAAGEAEPEDGRLEEALEAVIEQELQAAEPKDPGAEEEAGPKLAVTRVLFQRLAQATILREELPTLVAESTKDRELGSGAKPLQLPESGPTKPLEPPVRAIREIYKRKSSLPKELTGKGEEVSDLGLQTITHASFVGLAAVRTAGMPMSKYLGLARPPLLAVAGTVASKWWIRATAALGFWAAAIFLTSRILAVEPNANLTFKSVWTPGTLTALVALLAVAGFVLVPGVRVRNGLSPGKNLLYAIGLALSGFVLAAGLALAFGDLSVEDLLFAPGVDNPPEEALWAILALLGAVSFARFPLPDFLKKWRKQIEKLRHGGRVSCGLLALALVVFSLFTLDDLVSVAYDGVWEGDTQLWRGIAALCALVAAPVAGAFAVSLGRSRREDDEPG